MKPLPHNWRRTAFDLGAMMVLCIDLAGCGGAACGANHVPSGASPDQAIGAIREQVATCLDSNLKLPATGLLPAVAFPDDSGVGATRAQALCHAP